jgi:hypothetical protein
MLAQLPIDDSRASNPILEGPNRAKYPHHRIDCVRSIEMSSRKEPANLSTEREAMLREGSQTTLRFRDGEVYPTRSRPNSDPRRTSEFDTCYQIAEVPSLVLTFWFWNPVAPCSANDPTAHRRGVDSFPASQANPMRSDDSTLPPLLLRQPCGGP